MIDSIKFEVIRNTVVETTEEMSAALRRSAYLTNIKTRCDFSCVTFDAAAGLAHRKGLTGLKELVLINTQVTDAGLTKI